MRNEMKTKKQLIDELITLRKRVAESEISKDKQEPHDDLLLKSEERFRYFVENANDIVYSLTPDGIFTYVSPNWTEILGHDIHEVVGQPFESFVHPEDIPFCRAFLERVVATGKKQAGVEYRVRHKTGAWRWHISNASPMHNAYDEMLSYMGIARDITEHKQADEALRKSEKEYREVSIKLRDAYLWMSQKKDQFEARKYSESIIFLTADDGRICGFTEEAVGITNKSHSDIQGCNIQDILVFQEGQAFMDLIHKVRPRISHLTTLRLKNQLEDGPVYEAKLTRIVVESNRLLFIVIY